MVAALTILPVILLSALTKQVLPRELISFAIIREKGLYLIAPVSMLERKDSA
jgi:hypothetical protein